MKRSFNTADNFVAHSSTSSSKKVATKVNNSLSSDSRFIWPDAVLPNNLEESTKIKNSNKKEEDICSINDDMSSIEDDVDDAITEQDWKSLQAALAANRDSSDRLELSHDNDQSADGVKLDRVASSAALSMLDAECYHYFQQEYAKYVVDSNSSSSSSTSSSSSSSSTAQALSFEDFAVVTLSMIASFTNNNKSKKKALSSAGQYPSSSEGDDSSFDFSIQNWQKKVVETTRRSSSSSLQPSAATTVNSLKNNQSFMIQPTTSNSRNIFQQQQPYYFHHDEHDGDEHTIMEMEDDVFDHQQRHSDWVFDASSADVDDVDDEEFHFFENSGELQSTSYY